MPDGDRGRPPERPFLLILLAQVIGILALAFGLWLLLPHGPLAVALLGVLVLGAVFFGVWRLLSLPQLERDGTEDADRPR